MKNKKNAEENLRYKKSRTYSGGDCCAIMTAALLIVIIAYCTVVFGVALFGMSEMKAYAMEPGSLPEEQAAGREMAETAEIQTVWPEDLAHLALMLGDESLNSRITGEGKTLRLDVSQIRSSKPLTIWAVAADGRRTLVAVVTAGSGNGTGVVEEGSGDGSGGTGETGSSGAGDTGEAGNSAEISGDVGAGEDEAADSGTTEGGSSDADGGEDVLTDGTLVDGEERIKEVLEEIASLDGASADAFTVPDVEGTGVEYRLDGILYDGKEPITESGLHVLKVIATTPSGEKQVRTVRFVVKEDADGADSPEMGSEANAAAREADSDVNAEIRNVDKRKEAAIVTPAAKPDAWGTNALLNKLVWLCLMIIVVAGSIDAIRRRRPGKREKSL